MLDNKGIGLAIYNARKKLHMSRAELGSMINLHESTVNGYDATLKTVKKGDGTITLKPVDQNYAPKRYDHPGEVKILGKVVELRRKI